MARPAFRRNKSGGREVATAISLMSVNREIVVSVPCGHTRWLLRRWPRLPSRRLASYRLPVSCDRAPPAFVRALRSARVPASTWREAAATSDRQEVLHRQSVRGFL